MPVNDFDAILNAPGVDLTGTNPANLVDKEDQILNPPRYMDRHFIVPAEGPFFETGVQVWRVSTDPNGGTVLTELAKNVDWFLTHKYMEASYYLGDASPPKQLYASISFYNLDLVGRIKVTYQKLGGPFSIRADQLLALLGNYIYNPRICSYEQIAGAYVRFPPTDHPTDATTIEWGTTEVCARLADIHDAILSKNSTPGYSADQINDMFDQVYDELDAVKTAVQSEAFANAGDQGNAELADIHVAILSRTGSPGYSVDQINDMLEQLRTEMTDELNEVKTAIQSEAYIAAGEAGNAV